MAPSVPVVCIGSDDEVTFMSVCALPVPVVVLNDTDVSQTSATPQAVAAPLSPASAMRGGRRACVMTDESDDFVENQRDEPRQRRLLKRNARRITSPISSGIRKSLQVENRQPTEGEHGQISTSATLKSKKRCPFDDIRSPSFRRKLKQGILAYATPKIDTSTASVQPSPVEDSFIKQYSEAATEALPCLTEQSQFSAKPITQSLISRSDMEYSTRVCPHCQKRIRQAMYSMHQICCEQQLRISRSEDKRTKIEHYNNTITSPSTNHDNNNDSYSDNNSSYYDNNNDNNSDIDAHDDQNHSLHHAPLLSPISALAFDESECQNIKYTTPLPKGFVPLDKMDEQDMSGFRAQFISKSKSRKKLFDVSSKRVKCIETPSSSVSKSRNTTTKTNSTDAKSKVSWKPKLWVNGKPKFWQRTTTPPASTTKSRRKTSSTHNTSGNQYPSSSERVEEVNTPPPTVSRRRSKGIVALGVSERSVRSTRSSSNHKRADTGNWSSTSAQHDVIDDGDPYILNGVDDLPDFDQMIGTGLQWEGIGYSCF